MTTNDQNIALKLEHVTKRFSGLTAVSDVSFEMKKRAIHIERIAS